MLQTGFKMRLRGPYLCGWRNQMKNNLLLVAGVLLGAASPGFATIICNPATISAAAAAGVCTNTSPDGTTVLTNISIGTSTESGGAPAGAIDPTQVQIAFTNAGNLLNVTVSNLTPSNWALTGTQQFALILTYTETGGLPAYLTGVGDSFSGSGTGAGAISFDKTADGAVLITLTLAMMSQAPSGFPGGTLSTFNVSDTIQVHASTGTATLTSATNSFTTTASSVPEPTTSLLLGSGLLALGCVLYGRRSAHRLLGRDLRVCRCGK
jgi:hypothetical protein